MKACLSFQQIQSNLEIIGFRFDTKTENRAVQNADICLEVSEQMKELYERSDERNKDSIICIRNGLLRDTQRSRISL